MRSTDGELVVTTVPAETGMGYNGMKLTRVEETQTIVEMTTDRKSEQQIISIPETSFCLV